MLKICKGCGEHFNVGRNQTGRPRKHCFACKPQRLHQREQREAKAGKVPVSSKQPRGDHVSPVKPGRAQKDGGQRTTASQGAPPSAPATKCAYCHAFTVDGRKFCNDSHRRQFALKVADAARGKPEPLAVTRAGRHGSSGPQAMQLRREEQISGNPNMPLPPPTITGTYETKDVAA